MFGKYRPIGPSMSVFKYQDIFYFDTFFDSWGDFECKRQKDKNIGNTLGYSCKRMARPSRFANI